MAASVQLCSTCDSIPFATHKPPFGGESNVTPYSLFKLGNLGQIGRRACPLCRLVTIASTIVQRTENMSLGPTEEVTLHWDMGFDGVGRFQLLFLPKGFSRGTFLQFVHNAQAVALQPDCYFLSDIESQLDYDRVRGWLSDCEAQHGSDCYRPFDPDSYIDSVFPGLVVMRFIDVRRRCVVETRQPCRYITLSYVWGTVSMLRLSKANKSHLMEPESIRQAWDLLPRTIQDAICLVERLNETHLWVDSLCLIQNDGDDLAAGTNVMDLIYERSAFTIVAACGKDANAGLPGVDSGSRIKRSYVEEIKPGLSLAVYNSPDVLLESTVYGSRAWTLQEQLLSSRALFFIDDCVFFRCHMNIRSENCLDSTTFGLRSSTSEQRAIPIALREGEISTQSNYLFKHILGAYTTRSLSYQSDALRALSGIMRRWSMVTESGFFQGISKTFFNDQLLFYGSVSSLSRRKGFPSYSWAGWLGPINFLYCEKPIRCDEGLYLPSSTNERERKLREVPYSWITFHSRSPSGKYEMVWPPVTNEAQSSSSSPSLFSTRIEEFFSTKFHLGSITTILSPTTQLLAAKLIPQYPLLQFWTLTAFYRLSLTDVFRGRGHLFDREGSRCGQLCMDGFGETDFFLSKEVFEFALLSVARVWDGVVSGESGKSGNYYLVMCLEWNQGIAERRGIGWVSLKSIEYTCDSGPQWKEIILA